MMLYKVHFENNIPLSAHETDRVLANNVMEIEFTKDKKSIEYIITAGENEQDCINIAGDVANDIKRFL